MNHLPLLIATLLAGQTPDPVFDVKAILAPPLAARVLKSTEKDGIVTEEVMFHSEKDGPKSVDIFALFSYPKGAKSLPAFVWNQGGLYQATPYWTEFGAKRGYAVLCIDFPIPGYRSTGGYPINSGVELGDDPRKAPIYHGAVALLRAVSYLESRPEVDKTRIGMAGSSWGGFYTTLMAGLDPRLKAASSMFGAGSLQLGNAWWDGQGPNPKRDEAFRKRWASTLDPALRLPQSKTPIAWFTGTNDSFYWLPAVLDSHARAAGPKHLSLLPNYNHALTPAIDDQVFAWLDVHLKGKPSFLTVGPLEIVAKDHQATWSFKGPRKAVSAKLLLSYGEPGNWVSRYWLELPGKLEGQTCMAVMPKATLQGYAIGTVIDENGYHYCTGLQVFSTDRKGPEVPMYNGCSMWSDFDHEQQYLKLHGLPTFLSMKKHTAPLDKAATVLGPIHFTAGVPHVFRATIVPSQPAKVTVALRGSIDGIPYLVEKVFMLADRNTDVEVEFTPPENLTANLRATITRPEEGTFILSNVRFEPKSRNR